MNTAEPTAAGSAATALPDAAPLPGSVATPTASRTARSHPRGWTQQAVRDLAYCAAVSAWSITGFTVLVAGIAVTASLTPFVVGILAWIAVVYVVRWVTLVDRALAGWQRRGRVSAAYRGPVARGFIPFVRALTSDPQTWRDLAWLAMNSALGFAGGVVVLTTGSLALSYLSVPLTYRALSLDVRLGPSEATHPVDTISGALILFAIGVILVPVALGLARAFATFHAGLATKLLGLRPSGSHE